MISITGNPTNQSPETPEGSIATETGSGTPEQQNPSPTPAEGRTIGGVFYANATEADEPRLVLVTIVSSFIMTIEPDMTAQAPRWDEQVVARGILTALRNIRRLYRGRRIDRDRHIRVLRDKVTFTPLP